MPRPHFRAPQVDAVGEHGEGFMGEADLAVRAIRGLRP